jgi:hypothetical protein
LRIADEASWHRRRAKEIDSDYANANRPW